MSAPSRTSSTLKLADGLTLPLAVVTEKRKRRSPSHRGGKPLLTKEQKLERQRALAAKWRAKNIDKIRAYDRAYRAANPRLKACAAAYYQAHKAKWRERSQRPEAKAARKIYDAQHRDVIRAQRKAWGERNSGRAREIERQSRERNRGRRRARDRAWREANPEVFRAGVARAKAAKPELYQAVQAQSSQRRRSRKRGLAVEPVTYHQIETRDHGLCHLCRQRVGKDRTLDHLIPVVRGGPFLAWNLALAHDRCNKRRGVRRILPEETQEQAEAYIAAHGRQAQEGA